MSSAPSARRAPVLVLAAVVALALAGVAQAAKVTQYASGLDNPRGLAFGPDGYLYVAEGGDPAGDGLSTTYLPASICPQVGEAGPYTGGFTSRISKISPQHVRTTVVGGLPSSATSPNVGMLTSGVADVKFLDGTLYGIEAGAGCSHGLVGTHNTVFRVNANGTTTDIADLSAFQFANPVAAPDCCDYEPDGTWYSMVVSRGALYAVEPNHGEVDRITASGDVSRVVDVSAAEGHIVPTSISEHGDLYFGNLGLFPIDPGSAGIWKLTPSGHLTEWVSGLSTVLGTAWDGRGRLYALESMTVAGFPGPQELFSGRVVRIDPSGRQTTVVDGLSFPSEMTFGPDGALYISNFGFGAPAGAGEILRVDLSE